MGNADTKEINLSEQQLNDLPPNLYDYRHATKLYVRRNQLRVIDPQLFVQLDKLVEVSFRENLLVTIPQSLFELKHLVKLSLSFNQIAEIPPEIGKLRTLQLLTLAGNRITRLPDELGNLEHLIALDLQRNRLTEFPECVLRLKSLSVLALHRNRITSIPTDVRKLRRLIHCNMSYNRLTALPVEIGELTSMEELIVCGNRVESLPGPVIAGLKSLKNLDLHTNRLTSVPEELGNCTNLKRLNLAINRLTELPAQCLAALDKLEWLNLNDNQLTSLPLNGLGRLGSLMKLGLVQNKIEELPRDMEGLIKLVKIDLRRNRLKYLPPSVVNLPVLTNLLVDENPLLTEFGFLNAISKNASAAAGGGGGGGDGDGVTTLSSANGSDRTQTDNGDLAEDPDDDEDENENEEQEAATEGGPRATQNPTRGQHGNSGPTSSGTNGTAVHPTSHPAVTSLNAYSGSGEASSSRNTTESTVANREIAESDPPQADANVSEIVSDAAYEGQLRRSFNAIVGSHLVPSPRTGRSRHVSVNGALRGGVIAELAAEAVRETRSRSLPRPNPPSAQSNALTLPAVGVPSLQELCARAILKHGLLQQHALSDLGEKSNRSSIGNSNEEDLASMSCTHNLHSDTTPIGKGTRVVTTNFTQAAPSSGPPSPSPSTRSLSKNKGAWILNQIASAFSGNTGNSSGSPGSASSSPRHRRRHTLGSRGVMQNAQAASSAPVLPSSLWTESGEVVEPATSKNQNAVCSKCNGSKTPTADANSSLDSLNVESFGNNRRQDGRIAEEEFALLLPNHLVDYINQPLGYCDELRCHGAVYEHLLEVVQERPLKAAPDVKVPVLFKVCSLTCARNVLSETVRMSLLNTNPIANGGVPQQAPRVGGGPIPPGRPTPEEYLRALARRDPLVAARVSALQAVAPGRPAVVPSEDTNTENDAEEVGPTQLNPLQFPMPRFPSGRHSPLSGRSSGAQSPNLRSNGGYGGDRDGERGGRTGSSSIMSRMRNALLHPLPLN